MAEPGLGEGEGSGGVKVELLLTHLYLCDLSCGTQGAVFHKARENEDRSY